MIVYKYLHPDRIDVMHNACIRFTQFAALNDPFEATPNFEDFKQARTELLLNTGGMEAHRRSIDLEQIPSLTEEHRQYLRDFKTNWPEEFKEYKDSLIRLFVGAITDTVFDTHTKQVFNDYFAILSLSGTNSNPLMWSHYASSHTGCVLGFDSTSPFFEPGERMASGGLRRVGYSNERFIVPAIGLEGLSPEEQMRANDGMFFRKSVDWSYEHEYRILGNPGLADKTIDVPGGFPIHLYSFPPEAVQEVVLGYKMTNLKREEIVATCERLYPHAAIYQAIPDNRTFSMIILPAKPDLLLASRQRVEEFLTSRRQARP